MSGDIKHTLRGCVTVIAPVVWLLCVAGMALMCVVFVRMGLEPPHENKLAGVILIPLAPAIPGGILTAAAMLWMYWDRLKETHQGLAESAAATTASLFVGFAFAFLVPFNLVTALLATLVLAAHAVTIVLVYFQS